MRAVAGLVALFIALAQPGIAFAHASLVRSEPADGALVPEAPVRLRLTFNESVSPLVMRLIAPDGNQITLDVAAENTTVTLTPPALVEGTHVLSWRVISVDGHPVGGSLIFSIGSTSPHPNAPPVGDALVRGALWLTKVIVYAAVLTGIGGAFFRDWMWQTAPPHSARGLKVLVIAGLFATLLSTGIQGIDALGLQLSSLAQPLVWTAGLGTSYGPTAVVIAIALVLTLFASAAVSRSAARALTLAALLAAGIALAVSGHAGSAPPQTLTRLSVFVHVICAIFWVGALLPVLDVVRNGDRRALDGFSRVIPYPIAALVASGIILAAVQLDRVDALWTTNYGIVLTCKLAAVAALLGLAAANRYLLLPRLEAGHVTASTRLAQVVVAEFCIAAAILALVALWRFTPPPRALAAAESIGIHLHGTRAMAQLTLTPVRARDPEVTVEIFDPGFNALPVKEVTLIMVNPGSGIEPIRRPATNAGGVRWQVAGVRVPVSGRWLVRVDILIDDFEKVVLEDQIDLPRLP